MGAKKIPPLVFGKMGAHAFNLIRDFWPGTLTNKQINWLNDFHRIKSGELERFQPGSEKV
jgi:hypothetical protein